MFRYDIELLDCEWVVQLPAAVSKTCIELCCQKRGARCRVERLPAQLTVRGAPETDELFLSCLREGATVASSESISIGGMNRLVGARTVSLKAEEMVLCRVRILWCVAKEDATVYSRFAEDYAALGQQTKPQESKQQQQQQAVVPLVDGEGHTFASSPEAQKENSTTIVTSLSRTLTPAPPEDKLSLGNSLGCITMVQQQQQQQRQSPPACDDTLCPVLGKGGGALWSVSLPQHAPHGLLDYFVTSTQRVQRQKAWRNLYTSPAPLLVVNDALGCWASSRVANTPLHEGGGDILRKSAVKGSSALNDIALQPTRMSELSAYDLQQRRKKTIPWRTLISPVTTTTTAGATF